MGSALNKSKKEVVRMLRDNGFELVSSNRNEKWVNKLTGARATLPVGSGPLKIASVYNAYYAAKVSLRDEKHKKTEHVKLEAPEAPAQVPPVAEVLDVPEVPSVQEESVPHEEAVSETAVDSSAISTEMLERLRFMRAQGVSEAALAEMYDIPCAEILSALQSDTDAPEKVLETMVALVDALTRENEELKRRVRELEEFSRS